MLYRTLIGWLEMICCSKITFRAYQHPAAAPPSLHAGHIFWHACSAYLSQFCSVFCHKSCPAVKYIATSVSWHRGLHLWWLLAHNQFCAVSVDRHLPHACLSALSNFCFILLGKHQWSSVIWCCCFHIHTWSIPHFWSPCSPLSLLGRRRYTNFRGWICLLQKHYRQHSSHQSKKPSSYFISSLFKFYSNLSLYCNLGSCRILCPTHRQGKSELFCTWMVGLVIHVPVLSSLESRMSIQINKTI